MDGHRPFPALNHKQATPRPLGRTTQIPWLWPVALLAIAGAAALPLDISLAQWLSENTRPRFVTDVLNKSETFAHGIGVVVILLTIFVLDRTNRCLMPRVVLIMIGVSLATNCIKLSVGRIRPRFFDFEGGVADTFCAWMPMLKGTSEQQSLPSAHTGAAVALAVVLTWLYPRGRWLFAALAVLAAMQRLHVGKHFLSDVFWGAAIGWFFAAGVPRIPVWAAGRSDNLATERNAQEVRASGNTPKHPKIGAAQDLREETRRSA